MLVAKIKLSKFVILITNYIIRFYRFENKLSVASYTALTLLESLNI